jgi:hypothetical protein
MNTKKIISIKTLIDANLIESGCLVVWKRKSVGSSHTATIYSDGTIQTSDGVIHKSPSGAARHLNSGKPIDGWNVWKIAGSNESLSQLRSKLNV